MTRRICFLTFRPRNHTINILSYPDRKKTDYLSSENRIKSVQDLPAQGLWKIEKHNHFKSGFCENHNKSLIIPVLNIISLS